MLFQDKNCSPVLFTLKLHLILKKPISDLKNAVFQIFLNNMATYVKMVKRIWR